MKDAIKEIGVDGEGRLYVTPSGATFPMIYREGMGVQWDAKLCCLYGGGKPREWSCARWYQQIIKAASEQGCLLVISPATSWVNIPDELKRRILTVAPEFR